MGVSLLLFYGAYLVRVTNYRMHRVLALGGVFFNLASSIYLVWSVRVAGVEMPSDYPVAVITAHRIFATLVAVAMLVMVYTGAKRIRRIHIPLHRFFLPGYTLTYISGLVIFHG